MRLWNIIIASIECAYIYTLSYAERPDYLPDCIAIVWILGGIISAEGIDIYSERLDLD